MEFLFNKVILQPTSLCNLNCAYCYLPHRNNNFRMQPKITESIALSLESQELHTCFSVIWHGGEPLSCGLEHFSRLIYPFQDLLAKEKIRHYIQTNATLINKEWCDFFVENKFEVGVSLDGPIWANKNRVNWNNINAFSDIMRGIQLLKDAQIEFSIIAVVGNDSIAYASDIYNFFADLGCRSLAINIEEREGMNSTREICDKNDVKNFWSELFLAWKNNPVIRIREFHKAVSWMESICEGTQYGASRFVDLIPTVSWQGDVVVLSPELSGFKNLHYKDFIVGNVIDQPLRILMCQAQNSSYVQDFIAGVENCKAECKYFSFCGGGQASNKLFEHGRLEITETKFCINSKQTLIDAVLDLL